jgi:hypothetical protein
MTKKIPSGLQPKQLKPSLAGPKPVLFTRRQNILTAINSVQMFQVPCGSEW